jgi:hypothetical protein
MLQISAEQQIQDHARQSRNYGFEKPKEVKSCTEILPKYFLVKSFSQIEVGLTFNAETEIPSSGILC